MEREEEDGRQLGRREAYGREATESFLLMKKKRSRERVRVHAYILVGTQEHVHS